MFAPQKIATWIRLLYTIYNYIYIYVLNISEHTLDVKQLHELVDGLSRSNSIIYNVTKWTGILQHKNIKTSTSWLSFSWSLNLSSIPSDIATSFELVLGREPMESGGHENRIDAPRAEEASKLGCCTGEPSPTHPRQKCEIYLQFLGPPNISWFWNPSN